MFSVASEHSLHRLDLAVEMGLVWNGSNIGSDEMALSKLADAATEVGMFICFFFSRGTEINLFLKQIIAVLTCLPSGLGFFS